MNLSRIFLPILFIGVPLGIFTMQLHAYLRDLGIRRRGRRGEAEVIARSSVVEELYGQEYLATSKTRRVTTIRFQTPDAREWTFEEDLGAAAEAFPLGSRVPIYYDPGAPERHVVGKGTRLRSVLWLLFLSVPVVGTGFWLLLTPS